MTRAPYLAFAQYSIALAPRAGRSFSKCRFCWNNGQNSCGIVKLISWYFISGMAALTFSCHIAPSRAPQLGQNRDLQVWQTTFTSPGPAKISAPSTIVPHLIIFQKFSRTFGGVPSRSQYEIVLTRNSFNSMSGLRSYSGQI